MTSRYEVTPRTTLQRHRERGSHLVSDVHAILDAGLVAHVAFVVDGAPCVLPMAYARSGEMLYLHGAARNRMLGVLAGGAPVAIVVTLLDGLVFARTAFRHSMNYRSVVVFGVGRDVADLGEKRAALDAIVDHVAPGRSAELRASSEQEIAATRVIAVAIREASAKVRRGPPLHAAADLAHEVWAGELPIVSTFAQPVPAPDSRAATPLSASILRRIEAGGPGGDERSAASASE
jgi:nitroimidazol reductase NimA-like FMN-containing flavoprotein (pyridoxamine 5'-phosphate oxidase superfamily)